MTYEYECTSCQSKWEKEQSIKDDPLKSCPYCQKETAKRLISGKGNFILQGTGWYKTGGY
jgi:putative FmdB family regulatory protein